MYDPDSNKESVFLPVYEEAEREMDGIRAEKYAVEGECVFLDVNVYERVQELCEQEGITESHLISEALDALEYS